MVEKRATLKSIVLRGSVVGLTSGGGLIGTRFQVESTFDLASGAMKSRATDDAGRLLFSVVRLGDRRAHELELRSLVSGLLFENRSAYLMGTLKTFAIPVRTEDELLKLPTESQRRAIEVTSFGRQKLTSGLKVSWVIGQKQGNQLWIEKDSFFPARLIVKSSEPYDLQFDSFRLVQQVPVPRIITVSKSSEQLFREEVQDVTINPPLAGAFDSLTESGEAFTSQGEAADSDLKDLIRRFYSVLR
jgi:hypothetical protein